ncbi:hypothetical protein [Natrinema longum]|uniref:Uncharacterized protein n=1 Tax=Natrinema longum TaxID=370324 RepID=A0A8A2UDI3_9EURY|nr:hypothetical protein [Natrinema longum]MBZ6495334.1 hypothetical protein [Natrinema longum]QSW86693.1 hypothetical protein J0X27_07740 [Natrinema longum]
MDITRRKTLLATSGALGLAGCLGDAPDDDDAGTGNGGNDVEYTVFQLDPSLDHPLWATVENATGFVALLEDEYDDTWMVENPGEIDGLQSWLDETDFETSAIVYVETAGPNTCYNALDVSDVGVENGEIVGAAKAVDTSDGNEGCGSAETYPSAFVRVTADDLPSDATFTVVDGRGESSEAVADGRYADPANLPGHVRPDGDPAKLKELRCDDESIRRLRGPRDDEVALGEAYNDEEVTFAMRVHATQALAGGQGDSPRVGRGDEVRITMWNVSTDVQLTGSRHKWNLQVLTMDGWKDVRGTTDGDRIGYDDIGIEHRPGEGFEWAIEMTEEGIVAGHEHEDRLEVCPDLQPGRYRFVYHGIGSGEALAVEFDYNG